MSTKSPLLRVLDNAALRRFVTVGLVLVLAIVAIPLSPLLLLAAWLNDRRNRSSESPTVRVVLLVLCMVVVEVVGMVLTFGVAVRSGFGLLARGNGPHQWHRYRRLMGWYTTTQLRLICWVLRAPLEWRDHAPLDSGPVVLMARHTSFFDALIPAALMAKRHGLLPHHVVATGLQFAPLIDIVGHRFPNRFISRSPGVGSKELGPIQELGEVIDDRSGCIIFPEGTFRSPERFERVLRRLERRQPEHAVRARQLKHTLPPRPSGIWALLQGSPQADIVVCTNTGFERFGFVRDIVKNMPSRTPVVIETWRIARDQVPDDFAEFGDWLLAEFAKIDAWVDVEKS